MTEEAMEIAEEAFNNKFNHTLHAYIDITGDLIAGTLLSQIMFWFKPDKNGKSKIRVHKKDGDWLAKTRSDWYDEIRITPKQYDRAIKILKSKGFVDVVIHRFNGTPTPHIRPLEENIVPQLNEWKKKQAIKSENITISTFGESPFLPLGKIDIDQMVKSITENTTEPTTKTTLFKAHRGASTGGVKKPFDFHIVERQVMDICSDNSYDYDDVIEVLRYFYMMYYDTFREFHPRISKGRLETAINMLELFSDSYGIEVTMEFFKDFIDDYFHGNNHFNDDCNYSIIHFSLPNVLKIRYYNAVNSAI